MPAKQTLHILETLSKITTPLESESDLDPLLARIGEAPIVCLGEASHGTHDYYLWRAKISQRLIREKGFAMIAVEGDWPDCYRVNRHIKGYPNSEADAKAALMTFNRWPTWMWGNWEMVAFIRWLKSHNDRQPDTQKVGFYGLDIYSLYESLDAVLNYVEPIDPATAELVRRTANCFARFGEFEGESYAMALRQGLESCQAAVIRLLQEIHLQKPHYNTNKEDVFSTEQNALVALHAEAYYRAMLSGGSATWNIRDQHMVYMLDRLLTFKRTPQIPKIIIWEHNTHIGDARATTMAQEGMVNVGQLIRETYGAENVVLVGFGSDSGSVIASRAWGDDMERMTVPDGQPDSWEHLLRMSAPKDKLLIFPRTTIPVLQNPIPHRAIGVVYNPQYEHHNYVPSIIPERYDAFLFIQNSGHLHPLHIQPDGHQIPETFPWGM